MLDRERVRDVFAEAVSLPEAERGAYLDRACGGDARLRAEVDSLLGAAARRPGFMASPTTGGGNWVGPEPRGTKIGPYTLLEQIGHGGFGTVYLAEQEEPVRRRVALKIIKAGMDTREVIARFEAERQALAMMDHPHIARVLDAGATPEGRPYFVMELVPGGGRPITAYADEANLSVAERLDLFVQVCQAVQHAHAKGVIHRDIKPGNVLVSATEGLRTGSAKVIDFGIAKATDHRQAARTQFTRFQQLVGTPEYMSPEQAGGAPDVDTRTDVYSLGVLLYELLTGATPFDPETLREAAYDEIQRIIREVEPPKPSTRLSRLDRLASVAALRRTQPGRLSAEVSGDLDWIVMKALDKDRSRRYPTPSALAADVQRHLAGEPVEAAPPSAAYRARKFVRRNRVAVAAGAAVGAAVLAGGTAAVVMGLAEARQRRAAEATLVRAEAAEAQSKERAEQLETVAAFQAAQLGGIDAHRMGEQLRRDLLARARAAAEREKLAADAVDAQEQELERLLTGSDFTGFARDALDRAVFRPALETIASQFADQPLVKAMLLQTAADTMRSLGLIEGAGPPQEEALAIRRHMLGNDHPDTLKSIHRSGYHLLRAGRLEDAQSRLQEAVDGSQRVLGAEHPATLTATNDLGATLGRRGRFAEAEGLLIRVLQTRQRLLGSRHLDTLASLHEMGMLLYSQGRFKDAEGYLQEALRGQREVRGNQHPDTALAIANVGLVLQAQGKNAEAEPLLREGLELNRMLLGDEHPATLVSINNMGLLLHTMSKMPDAETYYREALRVNRRTLGKRHLHTLVAASNLGFLLMMEGRYPQAETQFREAMDGLREVVGVEHLNTLFATVGLAGTLIRMDRPREAVDLLAPVEGAARRVFVNDHRVHLGQFLSTLGGARVRAQELDAAEANLLEAWEILQNTDDPDLVAAGNSLARLFGARHRVNPAGGFDGKRDEWRKRVNALAKPAPPSTRP